MFPRRMCRELPQSGGLNRLRALCNKISEDRRDNPSRKGKPSNYRLRAFVVLHKERQRCVVIPFKPVAIL